MSKPRLIVASARLPVTLAHRGETWRATRSTGGLVTALKSVAERRPFLWLGWPGAHVPETERASVSKELSKHGSIPVFIGKSDIDGFYERLSNRVLWPLFHNLLDRSHYDLSGWKSYQKVNELFAEAIVATARPGDVVWVHDYQLALVPELLRRAGLRAPVGFFLHIPFPSAETYRTLPVRKEILRGILGADLVAFHSYEYVSHFGSACLRVLGAEIEPEAVRLASRRVQLRVLPIGIDPTEVRQMLDSEEAQQQLDNLRTAYPGMRIVVGVDRLDYTKGIPEKLLAFEELLRQHSRWRGKVVLIQVAAPSRTGVSEYQALKRQVDELVGRINGRYGTASYTPVIYINQSLSREKLTGLYRGADVALVTPVRDGMNLVALEYVAARSDLGGTLILSEFAGAAHCLPGAKLVNPYSVPEVAQVLAEVLKDPTPSRSGFEHMQRFVNENTSMRWANRFLDCLEQTGSDGQSESRMLDVKVSPIHDRVQSARSPLLLLDYDGTLRPFVVDPATAAPSRRIAEVLQSLSRVARVYVVSGRSQQVLEQWLGMLGVGLVCEHGLGMREPGGKWELRAKVSITKLRRTVDPLLEDFVARTPGSTIEYKNAGIAWHYRGADPEYGGFHANELLLLLEGLLKRRPFGVLRGNRVVEIRHERVSKGRAALDILGRNPSADFLLCAGDDRTDEEMMEALPDAWQDQAVTVWVGNRNARARYWVESSEDLLEQLAYLAQSWARRGLRARPGT